ncbi:SCO1664 family protein [Egibacter rhizosphaerae]|uniref:SCO1664 family protein n=1 Tax=Egibacter rhizosphaerae TaxID=1670831 RepID=A0A411YIL7_9ACTN|nr:SCO1664 family protein [Egibacter rhizosphaerae]QBI21134.1 SCO1664 family protein [Egibacter rhizosphaerae]
MALSPPDALARLADSRLAPLGRLANASNGTVLVSVGGAPTVDPDELVADPDRHGVVLAIYKPRAGERPLLDFPGGTLCQREVAAYELSAFLGWDLVPPTVLRDGPLGEGSVQLFVPHDPSQHYFTLVEDPGRHEELARIALFDLVTNNADRKAGHVIEASDGELRGIDHGLTFHVEAKLRTVMWDLHDVPLPASWRDDLECAATALSAGERVARRLTRLLEPEEIDTLARRAAHAATLERLPLPPEHRRPYPWPPL